MSKWSAVLEIPLPSPGPTGNGAALSVEQFDYIMFEVCGQFGALSMQIQATLDVTSGVWTPVGYDLNSDSTTITAAGLLGSFSEAYLVGFAACVLALAFALGIRRATRDERGQLTADDLAMAMPG